MESEKRRRKAEKGVDRLSALPDCLLLDIIKSLGLKEAAKTAILSKQWRFLWTNLPFDFSSTSEDIDGKRSFVASVHAALAVRRGRALKSLSVAFDYDSCFDSDVDSWLNFTAENKAEKVSSTSGKLQRVAGEAGAVAVPDVVITEACEFRAAAGNRGNFIRLSSFGYPTPEPLLLAWDSDSDLEISAPYMNTLILLVTFAAGGLMPRFVDAQALRDALIDLSVTDWESVSKVELRTNVQKLLRLCLQNNMRGLVLYCSFTRCMSILAADGWRFEQLLRVEYLSILGADDLLGSNAVLPILESCPYLQRLDVDIHGQTQEASIDLGPIRKEDLNCDLTHLKIVRIFIYSDLDHFGEASLRLARVLLKRAPFLEKMVVIIRKFASLSIDNVKKILLTCPRSSQEASIVVH